MDILAALIGSRVRADLIAALFGARARTWKPFELEHATGRPHSPIYRELRRLAAAGLLRTSVREGRQAYEPVAEGPVGRELTRLVLQTRGRIPRIRHALVQLRSRTTAWAVSGSTAVVGPRAQRRATVVALTSAPRALVRVQLTKVLGSDLDLHCMSTREWVARLEKGDVVLRQLRAARKLWILGSWEDLVARETAELESKKLLRTVRRNWREELSDEWDEDWDPFAPAPGAA